MTVPLSPDEATRLNSGGPRVLVVDDNGVNQKVAAHMLTKLGSRVELAANGKEAVDLVSRLPFDVIFMDCMMPEMDGYEATAAIRRLPGAIGKTPIVAMTANAMQGDRERCLAVGMDDYLSKPIQSVQLKAALSRWGGREQEGGAPAPIDPAVLQSLRQLQEPDAPDVVTELIDLFLGDLEARRDQLSQAIDAGDAEVVRSSTHALKSSAAYMGARELAHLCQQVEGAAQRGDLGAAAHAGAALELEAERTAAYLRAQRLGGTTSKESS